MSHYMVRMCLGLEKGTRRDFSYVDLKIIYIYIYIYTHTYT